VVHGCTALSVGRGIFPATIGWDNIAVKEWLPRGLLNQRPVDSRQVSGAVCPLSGCADQGCRTLALLSEPVAAGYAFLPGSRRRLSRTNNSPCLPSPALRRSSSKRVVAVIRSLSLV